MSNPAKKKESNEKSLSNKVEVEVSKSVPSCSVLFHDDVLHLLVQVRRTSPGLMLPPPCSLGTVSILDIPASTACLSTKCAFSSELHVLIWAVFNANIKISNFHMLKDGD